MAAVRDSVQRALLEDLGDVGDVTSQACLRSDVTARGRIVARGPGVLAGVEVARECFLACDPEVEVGNLQSDGDVLRLGDVILVVVGRASVLLAVERVAINFLQRLSGIATRVRAYVDALKGTEVRVLDTRKTTPGLRALEKYAVTIGGAESHRFGLFDGVLLKENHFALAGAEYEEVVRHTVERAGGHVIAEARDVAEARAAVRGGAAVVLLDNFQPGQTLVEAIEGVREEAGLLDRIVEIEASGGVTLENVGAFSACGVDRVSSGELTHSVQALDMTMLVEEIG